MPNLLPGLLHDLRRRCVHLRDRLINLPDDPAFNDLAVSAYQAVATVVREIDGLLADQTLRDPAFAADHLRRFRRWAEQVILTESYAVPSLERFHPDDRRLTGLASRLIAEAAVPLPDPVVVATSTQYYWTLPYFTLVSVPAGEATSLLGLPDLAHELGHLLVVLHPLPLLAAAEQAVADHFAMAVRTATNRASPHTADLVTAALQWSDEWLTELTCDAVGTYIFGAAFPLQHVRLCALFGNPLWKPSLGDSAAHPADETRLRVAVAVLRAMGDESGATLAEDAWSSFAAASPEPKPAGYNMCYPPALIAVVATHLHEACRQLGIRPCPDDTGQLAGLVGEAWRQFQTDPEAYGQWEDEALGQL